MVAVVDFPEQHRRRRGALSPQAIEVEARARQALALRQRGYTYDEIATILGFADRSGARKAVERALAQWMHQGAEEFRASELERSEMMLARLWPLVDCDTPDLKAMDRILKWMEYRAKVAGLYNKRESPPDTYPGAPNPAATEKVEHVNRFIELMSMATGGELNAGFGHNPGPNDEDDARDEDDRARPVRHYDLAVADEFADDQPAQEEVPDEDDDDPPEGAYWSDGKECVDRMVDGQLVTELVQQRGNSASRVHPPVSTKPPPPNPEAFRTDDLHI